MVIIQRGAGELRISYRSFVNQYIFLLELQFLNESVTIKDEFKRRGVRVSCI